MKSKDKPYVSNYPPLRDFIANHAMRCNWQIVRNGDPENPDAFVESYSAPGMRECIIVVYGNGNGWAIYTPNESTKIDETLADAEKRLTLANRKLTLGERIDRAELTAEQRARIERVADFIKAGES